MLGLRRKDIVCQQAVELVTDYLEGSLSRRERRRFEAHLLGLSQLCGVPRTDKDDYPVDRHGRTR